MQFKSMQCYVYRVHRQEECNLYMHKKKPSVMASPHLEVFFQMIIVAAQNLEIYHGPFPLLLSIGKGFKTRHMWLNKLFWSPLLRRSNTYVAKLFCIKLHMVSLIKYGNNFIKLLDVNFEGNFFY
jgi:hypothetical protein